MTKSLQVAPSLIDHIPFLAWSAASDGKQECFNRRWREYVGSSAVDCCNWSEAIHPDDRSGAELFWQSLLVTGDYGRLETRIRRADGQYLWFLLQISPVLDNHGRIASWCAIGSDIDRLKQDSLEARRRENRLKSILDCIPGMVLVVSPQAEVLAANEQVKTMTGWDGHGKVDWQSYVHPDDVVEAEAAFKRAVAENSEYEAEYRCLGHNGEYSWFRARALPHRQDGKTVYWCVLLMEIASLKAAESTLRRREEELQILVDHVPGMIACAAEDGTYLYANKRLLDYVGMDLDELLKVGWLSTIHPSEREQTRNAWITAVQTGTPMEVEHRLRRANGEYRWVHALVEPMRNAEGDIEHWYGLLTDVEEVRQAHQEVLDRERELTQTLDLIPGYVWRADANGQVCSLNKRLLDYLGYPNVESFIAVDPSMYMDQPQAKCVVVKWETATATGEPFDYQYRLKGKDGIFRWFHSVGEASRSDTGVINGWYGISINIDDRKRFEEALRKTEKQLANATQRAMVGELAASIAHEVNQPLTALVANGAACLKWLSLDPPNLEQARQVAEWIVSDGADAATIIQRIRALFSRTPLERSRLSINILIDDVLEVISSRVERKRLVVERSFDPALPEINGDPVQLRQVVFNLLQNACDAVEAMDPSRRIIRVATSVVDRSTVLIEITDLGAGFETNDRMFEPFYTTKENGMGMGLAICRSIVEAHHGRLWAKARVGCGTTFLLSLPIQDSRTIRLCNEAAKSE